MRLGVVLVSSEPRSVLSWSWKQSLSIQSRCSCSLAAGISSPLKISFKEARTRLKCAPCSKSTKTSQAKRQCYGSKSGFQFQSTKPLHHVIECFVFLDRGSCYILTLLEPNDLWHMTWRILSEAWTDYGSGQVGSCHPQRSAGDCCSSSYVWLHIDRLLGVQPFNDVVGLSYKARLCSAK